MELSHIPPMPPLPTVYFKPRYAETSGVLQCPRRGYVYVDINQQINKYMYI